MIRMADGLMLHQQAGNHSLYYYFAFSALRSGRKQSLRKLVNVFQGYTRCPNITLLCL